MLVRDITQPGSGGTMPALENTCCPVIGRPTPPSTASTKGLPLTMHSANKGRTTKGLIMTDSVYCFELTGVSNGIFHCPLVTSGVGR
ncbi:hypothetical protein D3C81_1583280 [compost metagenome]